MCAHTKQQITLIIIVVQQMIYIHTNMFTQNGLSTSKFVQQHVSVKLPVKFCKACFMETRYCLPTGAITTAGRDKDTHNYNTLPPDRGTFSLPHSHQSYVQTLPPSQSHVHTLPPSQSYVQTLPPSQSYAHTLPPSLPQLCAHPPSQSYVPKSMCLPSS